MLEIPHPSRPGYFSLQGVGIPPHPTYFRMIQLLPALRADLETIHVEFEEVTILGGLSVT